MCLGGSVAVTSTLPTPPPRHVAAAARVRDVPGAGGRPRPAPARARRGAPQQEVEHGQLLGPPQQTRLRERGRGRRGGPSPGGVHHENMALIPICSHIQAVRELRTRLNSLKAG